MRVGGSKAKGSDFERIICKRLSLWVSNSQSQDLFWRSAMSGGRATIQLAKGVPNKTQVGDISAIDRAGHELLEHFVIECKFYSKLDIETGIINRKGILYQFWKKLRRDCKILNKQPMLIVKQNHSPILLITSPTGRISLGVTDIIAILPQWIAEVYLFEDVLKLPCPF